MPKKILTIVGARPQFIKAATISRLLRADKNFQEVLVHTGQHYDANMSQTFFDELEIAMPEYHLAIGSDSHGIQTGKMLASLEQTMLQERPDWVLIYGDTNSTLAGALAAAKLHIPIAHVEAGLRSFNRRMPEEINRIVADQLADLLLVPTQQAQLNLQHEGIAADKIHWVGDVMYDAALFYGAKADNHSHILSTLQLKPKEFILVTIHRAENTDDIQRLTAIISALKIIAEDIKVVLPLHPRTRKILLQYQLLDAAIQSFCITEPLSFTDMVMLEKNAALIATDSGGVQKEAFFYQVPCVTLRDETEWVELVSLGWNTIVPPVSSNNIVNAIQKALISRGQQADNLYGTGAASERIVALL
ncbi:O-antigen biosynthesis protein WlbD [soil metagenome]